MFYRHGKTTSEFGAGKNYSNIEDSPAVEPLRIRKSKSPTPPNSGRPSLAFETSNTGNQQPDPNDRDKTNTSIPYETRSHLPPHMTDVEQIAEASIRPAPYSKAKSTSPKSKQNLKETEGICSMRPRALFSSLTSESQDTDISDQHTSNSKPQERNPEQKSQNTTYLQPDRFQNNQSNFPQELDASPSTRKNIPPHIKNGMGRVDSIVSISTTRASRGSPPGSPSDLIEGHQAANKLIGFTSPTRNSGTQASRKELHQLNLSQSPPPAYSSAASGSIQGIQAASDEKRNGAAVTVNAAFQKSFANLTVSNGAHLSEHPAFASKTRNDTLDVQHATQSAQSQQYCNQPYFQGAGLNSPPLLPEGWISHLDPNSGQYYYIHLPTQATQWEFPTGPTPLNYKAAPHSQGLSIYGNLMSPGSSTFGKIPLASPGFSSRILGYNESMLSIASQTPTTAGFTGPPPSAGIDMYKVAPTNGVYFGPYLRYINMDIQRGIWLGTIMLITDAPQPPTIHIHRSVDLSPNPRQLKPNPVATHQRWTFYRYNVDLEMGETSSEKWTYAITSHLGCTRYEFVIASRFETQWRFIAHSGNDFSINTSSSERSKLGGIGFMWKDILQKHTECGGFHVQLGLGDQVYGDRLWKEIPLLKQWLAISGKENRKNAAWTARHEEDVSHAYFHYYTSHFDQPFLREAFAQIPHILQINHHDISFDGFGSYPDYLQSSNIFENIGRIGTDMYLLFQHHTTLDILRKSNYHSDLFTVTGSGWHFVKYLGPAIAVVGPDCRSERNQRQVLAGPTYQGIFPKVATLPSSIQHCIWMISVPIVYPRLDTVESIAQTFTTAKKGVTGTYNLLGKMTSSVAGVVGGKQAVASGFSQVKKVVGKSGLMGNVLNTFGDIDIADELRDMWTHESKDLERTYLIRTLQSIAHQKRIRMTFLSGDVNCGGAGLVHDPSHPSDYKTMYQIISSAVVAAPPPYYVLRMLHNHKSLYIPANGIKTTNAVSDTKEDMMEIFQTETNGAPRDLKKLIGRRNYVIFLAYDPETVTALNNGTSEEIGQQPNVSKKISLAVDFIVQGEAGITNTSKYGPVIIPCLEHSS
ncbi:Uncharacterized protein GcC1_124002 [Golovinomyces cichoracearum]|uniref:WW domain-containing protein n=1 Tax=Golovinomyces cichoracearum TaxID=62708 RepID=A0A420I6C1_9PEZI|nr:Uncharacterized protein GcC1_124002 [Golovinomyces cichoracearum]